MNVLIATNPTYEEFLDNEVEKYAEEQHSIKVINNKHDVEVFANSKNWKYDIGISFMYLYKVPAKEVNTHTWINFHPAPLPEYKGRNLCYHAIMNGEKEFGATIHYMDENFDTGNIIHVYRFLIYPSDTAEDVSRKAIQSCKLLFETMFPDILAGKEFESVPNLGGTYYKKEKINDNVNYHNYRQERQIRAVYFPPHYPTMIIGGVKYKIVKEE